MSSAREQAEDAVRTAFVELGEDDPGYVRLLAKAASDVWEPLLRDLVDRIMEEVATGYLAKPRYATWDAITRAKEALDG